MPEDEFTIAHNRRSPYRYDLVEWTLPSGFTEEEEAVEIWEMFVVKFPEAVLRGRQTKIVRAKP